MNRSPIEWTLDALLKPMDLAKVPAIGISGVCLDSRLVRPGDIYLAVGGANTHGVRYAQSAIDAGAVAVLIAAETAPDYESLISSLVANGIPVLQVPRLDEQCAQIAERFYDKPDGKMTLIAVTGTDGKTSVCRFIASALSKANRPCGYIGTLGWGTVENLQVTELTTPDVVSLRRMLACLYQQGADYVALEASSHGIAEGRLDGLQLDIAVLTNLGRDHLDYHKTLEAYRQAKKQLFTNFGARTIVLNGCDSLGHELAGSIDDVDQLIYCACQDCVAELPDERSCVVATGIVTKDTGLEFSLHDAGHVYDVDTQLLGSFNVDNLLACYASMRACGVAANDAVHALTTVPPVPGRMERLGGDAQPVIVIDYCHTPQALTVAIGAVRVHCKGQLWVVFGCGGDRDPGKRAFMAKAAEEADHVVLTDDNPRTEASIKIITDTLKGFTYPDAVTVIADRADAIRHAVSTAASSDLILIAGKGHENYQIIGETRFPFSDRAQALAALELAS